VIGKVLRGSDAAGLLRYLYGPGRANEHVRPRLVAGWDDPVVLEPAVRADGRPDLRRLADQLNAPLVAAGLGPADKGVYHLVVAAAKADERRGLAADRPLSDPEFSQISADLMGRTGLAKPGADGVRWVAVRHDTPGAEHVHIVATLASESGRRVWPRNDFYRIGEGCRAAEDRYGLRRTAERDRTAAKRPTRAETEKAARVGEQWPARVELRREVRAAAGGADSIEGFFARLRDVGLIVKERRSELDGALTGYAVAVPGRADAAGVPVFYSGGKLAADLTPPKLAARWAPATGADQARHASVGLDADQRAAMWAQAIDAARRATAAVGAHQHDPAGAADAAWAASDFLAATARVIGGRRGSALHTAAEDYDRAARQAWGRLPEPSPAGAGIRAASGLLAAARLVRRAETAQMLALLAQLAALAEAVGRMRTEQDRAVQAAAVRQAAGAIRTEHGRRLAGVGGRPGAVRQRPTASEADRYRGPLPPQQRPGRSR